MKYKDYKMQISNNFIKEKLPLPSNNQYTAKYTFICFLQALLSIILTFYSSIYNYGQLMVKYTNHLQRF